MRLGQHFFWYFFQLQFTLVHSLVDRYKTSILELSSVCRNGLNHLYAFFLRGTHMMCFNFYILLMRGNKLKFFFDQIIVSSYDFIISFLAAYNVI